MSSLFTVKLRSSVAALAMTLMTISSVPANATHVPSGTEMKNMHGSQMIIPMMNPERGKKLFVDKGCVACHAVNGVGGHDAPDMAKSTAVATATHRELRRIRIDTID